MDIAKEKSVDLFRADQCSSPLSGPGFFVSYKKAATIGGVAIFVFALLLKDTSAFTVLSLAALLGLLGAMLIISGRIEEFLADRDAFVEVNESSPLPCIEIDFSKKTHYLPNT